MISGHSHDGHDHDHDHGSELSEPQARVRALETILAEKGYITGGCKRNREYLEDKITIEKSIREGLVEVAIDPQTSGGLLIAIGKRHAARFEGLR